MSISYGPSRKGRRVYLMTFELLIEDRFAKIEEKIQQNQQQSSRWQEDSVRDFQAVEAYPTRVHAIGEGDATNRGIVFNSE